LLAFSHITLRWLMLLVVSVIVSSFVKFDGSSFGNLGKASFGGLLIYVNGIWIHGFSSLCGRASNLFVELLAIWRDLHLTWDLGH